MPAALFWLCRERRLRLIRNSTGTGLHVSSAWRVSPAKRWKRKYFGLWSVALDVLVMLRCAQGVRTTGVVGERYVVLTYSLSEQFFSPTNYARA